MLQFILFIYTFQNRLIISSNEYEFHNRTEKKFQYLPMSFSLKYCSYSSESTCEMEQNIQQTSTCTTYSPHIHQLKTKRLSNYIVIYFITYFSFVHLIFGSMSLDLWFSFFVFVGVVNLFGCCCCFCFFYAVLIPLQCLLSKFDSMSFCKFLLLLYFVWHCW